MRRGYYDPPDTSTPETIRDLTPTERKLVRQLAAAGGSGYLVSAMRGREALVTEQRGELWRGDAYNYATLRAIRDRGVVEYGESWQITYRGRQRGDSSSADPITLTELGRTLAGLREPAEKPECGATVEGEPHVATPSRPPVTTDRRDDMAEPARWWVSWYGAGAFEYHGPWWITGSDVEGRATICAAVLADSEDEARRVIAAAHDSPLPPIEWRFTERRSRDWAPFGDRFPEAPWMQWPPAAPSR